MGGATSCSPISDADDVAVGMGNGGGRGHQRITFRLVLASGGLRHRGAYGLTDELSKTIVTDPVRLVDFHATSHAALDIDPAKELFDGSRPVPITDHGQPIAALF
jgi:hypothetical protein